MDRKRQLSNVSFGGAWSEQIAADEALSDALDCLDKAVKDTVYEDVRGFEGVAEAVRLACASHPKGEMLHRAWWAALNITNSGLRSDELKRIASTLRAGIGERVAPWSAGL